MPVLYALVGRGETDSCTQSGVYLVFMRLIIPALATRRYESHLGVATGCPLAGLG